MTKEVDSKNDVRARENLARTLLQHAVIKELDKFAKDSKAAVHHQLEDGETIKVSNARGGELGSIYRTRGKQSAVIEDKAVVLAEAAAAGAELEDCLPPEGSQEYWDAVDVLQEHAPHLVRVMLPGHEESRISEEVLEEYHRDGSVRAGWRISEGKGGYTGVRTSKLGKEVAQRMFDKARGVLEIGGGNNGE